MHWTWLKAKIEGLYLLLVRRITFYIFYRIVMQNSLKFICWESCLAMSGVYMNLFHLRCLLHLLPRLHLVDVQQSICRGRTGCRFAEASCASSHVGILCDGSALRCQSQSNPFTVLFVLFKSSHCTRTSFSILALFNQIYEYLRYLSKTLKLGMLFLEGIRTDRTVRRKTCLKNWRSSERHLFEVPLLNVFWASMLCSFQLSPPHSLDWYTWLWGSVFFVAARLDVSLDVFITSTTSWPVHLHAWNFPIFFFQKMWSCKLATHCNTQHFLLLLHVAAWKRAQHE